MKKDGGGKDGGVDLGTVGVGIAVFAGMGILAGGMAFEAPAVVAAGAIVLGAGIVVGAAKGFGFGSGPPSSAGGVGPPSSEGGSESGSETGSAGGTPSAPCFAAGTLVTLGDGSRKAIEMVDVGDLVLSQREDGGALGAQRVSHIWEHTVERTLLLTFCNGQQLETTKEHRFHLDGGGFVSAGKLRPGAALNTPANNVVLRDAKERSATTQVYNLEVENFHTYFVGDNLVWVHNRKDTESEGEGTEGEEKSDNK
jgi:Pretoxin HINT domain